MKENLFERIDFAVVPQYEQIIDAIGANRYSVLDDFFTDEEIAFLRDSLLQKHEEENFKKAAIGSHTNELIVDSIRGDYIYWINEEEQNEAEALFFKKISDLIDYLNRTCFMGILHKEFHYAIYPEGKYYKRHLDTFRNDGRRKLSIVCYLNDENWKAENGGELVLYLQNNGKEEAKTIYPFPGRLVIFESQVLEHEVKKVNASERLSITGWLKTR